MAIEGIPFVIALEEHYYEPELVKTFDSPEGRAPEIRRRLDDLGELRTTSGNLSTPALLCSMMELGVDRILFSVDWPFVQNVPGTKWMHELQLSSEDKTKILSGNARRLLKI